MGSKRPNPELRIRLVGRPDAAVQQRDAVRALGAALGDLLVDRARSEVAASLGVTPETIDHERGALDDDARSWLSAVAERGAVSSPTRST